MIEVGENVTFSRFTQSLKAFSPTSSRYSPNSILVREVQPSKAFAPIICVPGSDEKSRDEQPKNAPLSISSTKLKSILTSFEQPLNALMPI